MLGSAAGLGPLVDTSAPATTSGRGSNAGALDIDGDGRQDPGVADIARIAPVPRATVVRYRYRLRNTSGAGFSGTVLVGRTTAREPADSEWRLRLGAAAWPHTGFQRRRPGRFRLQARKAHLERRTCQVGLHAHRMRKAICVGGGCSFSQNLKGGAGPLSFGDFNGDGLTDLFYYSGQVQDRRIAPRGGTP